MYVNQQQLQNFNTNSADKIKLLQISMRSKNTVEEGLSIIFPQNQALDIKNAHAWVPPLLGDDFMLMSTSSSKDFGDLKISTTYTPSFFQPQGFLGVIQSNEFSKTSKECKMCLVGHRLPLLTLNVGKGKLTAFLAMEKSLFVR